MPACCFFPRICYSSRLRACYLSCICIFIMPSPSAPASAVRVVQAMRGCLQESIDTSTSVPCICTLAVKATFMYLFATRRHTTHSGRDHLGGYWARGRGSAIPRSRKLLVIQQRTLAQADRLPGTSHPVQGHASKDMDARARPGKPKHGPSPEVERGGRYTDPGEGL